MNREEVLIALRGTGYEGPTSYTKSRLLQMLVEKGGGLPAGEPPTTGAASPQRTTQARSRKRGATVPDDPNTRLEEWEGLDPGKEFRVTGERGWFRFVCHVTTPSGETWIDAHGGASGHLQHRAFRPERVKKGKANVRAFVPRKKGTSDDDGGDDDVS